jgi:hypothetical protein
VGTACASRCFQTNSKIEDLGFITVHESSITNVSDRVEVSSKPRASFWPADCGHQPGPTAYCLTAVLTAYLGPLV